MVVQTGDMELDAANLAERTAFGERMGSEEVRRGMEGLIKIRNATPASK